VLKLKAGHLSDTWVREGRNDLGKTAANITRKLPTKRGKRTVSSDIEREGRIGQKGEGVKIAFY